MIEMSIETETVLTEDGVGVLITQNAVGYSQMASPLPSVAISRGHPFMVDEVLAEPPAGAAGPEVEGDGAGVGVVRGGGKALRLRNGVQATVTQRPRATPTVTQATPTPTQQSLATPTPTQQPQAMPTATQRSRATPTVTQATPTPTQQPLATPTPTQQPQAMPTVTQPPQATPTVAQQPMKAGKRRYSSAVASGAKHGAKRRRRAASESEPVLPTDFLLGGNIFDPLNLNSLLDEEVSRVLNAETPKSSPLPARSREPVEILIPRDITDPLNLSGRGGHAHKGVLATPMKSGRRRHRNRHHAGVNTGVSSQHDPADPERSKDMREEDMKPLFPVLHTAEVHAGAVPEVSSEGAMLLGLHTVEQSPRPYELNTSINCRDEVVPPILPPARSNPSASSAHSQTHTGSSHVANSAQSSNHGRRRRTVSRSHRLSITPTPCNKQTSLDQRRSQTFHTPVVGGVTGSYCTGSHQTPHHRRIHRKFQYGTYSCYYGYQTPGLDRDPRLAFFKPEWFRGKRVLDVGCNTGHVTLAIAKNWSPAHILGLDIDGRLVHAARQNLRHFLSELQRQEVHRDLQKQNLAAGEAHRLTQRDKQEQMDTSRETGKPEERREKAPHTEGSGLEVGLVETQSLQPFPISFRLSRGPISAPPLLPPTAGVFPNNVSFMKGNYVAESDVAVASQRAGYDVILCLSVTKWVQLNWGDAGLQRLFRRVYTHLTPGGLLILETQPWSSYSRRKRLTETTYRNYNSIRLKPEQFSSYLTTEVGFTSYQLISTTHSTEDVQKPVYIFHKGPASSRK